MQGRVARRIPELLTVSRSSEVDIRKAFDVDKGAITAIPLGVDTDVFTADAAPERCPAGSCVASADALLKACRICWRPSPNSVPNVMSLTLVSNSTPTARRLG